MLEVPLSPLQEAVQHLASYDLYGFTVFWPRSLLAYSQLYSSKSGNCLSHAGSNVVTPGRTAGTTIIECPSKPYIPCNQILTGFDVPANYTRSHVYDSRAPYPCSKGCDQRHASLYTLAAHEEKCKGVPVMNRRETTLRVPLTKAAAANPCSIIVLARSSSEPPDVWYAHGSSLTEGLYSWGRKIPEHFMAFSTLTGPAILHAASDTQTRYLPAPDINDSTALHGQARWEAHRAYRFTQAWTADIALANGAGITPTVLSVGLDGWACDVRMLQPWLKKRAVSFHLYIRMNTLRHGMTETFVTQHYGIFWAQYDLTTILAAIEQDGKSDNAAASQLIAA